MKRSFEIESDCLDITKRLKDIDKDYFVVRDLDREVFELHNHGQAVNSYCLTLPFDCLDDRTIDFVLKTRVTNSDALFEELEKQNEKLRRDSIKEILNGFEEKIYDS